MGKGFALIAAAAFSAAVSGNLSAAESYPLDRLSESEGAGLFVSSDPSAADVYVNGVFRGQTPLELKDLLPGTHELRLERDERWPRNLYVSIPAGKRLSAHFELREALGILSVSASPRDPSGSSFRPIVSIDGEKAFLGDNSVKEGLRAVRLRAFGFEDSERTIYVPRGSNAFVDFVMESAAFSVGELRTSRRRFNPSGSGQLGTVRIAFTVSAPGRARLTVRAPGGATVYAADIAYFADWDQSAIWDGKASDGSPLPDGSYEIVVEARSGDGTKTIVRRSRAEIDSGIEIRPGAVAGDVSGFLFVPTARNLPRGSFQLDSLLLFGKPFGAAEPFGAPPAAFGLRFSPADKTEAAAALRIDAANGGSADVGLSLKRALLAGIGPRPFALAATARWTYADSGEPSPFGAVGGIEIGMPAEMEIGRTTRSAFVFHFSPSLRWVGPQGLPENAVPTAAAGAALEWKAQALTIGLAARVEKGFSADSPIPVSAALEARFFPPPSFISFNALCGFWRRGGNGGLFAGGGLALIY